MSTRACLHFTCGSEIVANIYRHGDGYPDTDCGVLADLKRFFADVTKQTKGGMGGNRFNDPSYLSAKYVVWQAGENARSMQAIRGVKPKAVKPLDFISLGITNEDPWDLAFVYTVDCSKLDDKGRPTVTFAPYEEPKEKDKATQLAELLADYTAKMQVILAAK